MSKHDVIVEVYSAGDGYTYPESGCIVSVNYTGTLERNGQEFDSTYRRSKPFQFCIGSDQVIPGLEFAITQLSLGEKAKATIPANLAFGDKGLPGLVPPRSNIVFDIELLSISSHT